MSSIFTDIGIAVIILIVLAFLSTSFTIVRQNNVGLYSILGKYKSQFGPGLHFRIPFISTVNLVEMAQQPMKLKEQTVISKDNAEVHVSLSMTYHVTNPYKYAFENSDSVESMVQQARSDVRDIIGTMELNEVLNSAEKVNAQLSARIADITDAYGLNVDRINIDQLDPSPEIQESMNKLVNATRERDAEISKAEGDAKSIKLRTDANNEAMVSKAEAEAKAVKLAADAEAYRIEKANQALNNVSTNYLMAQNIDAFKEVANSDTNTVVMPSVAIDSLGQMPAMKTLLADK